MTSRDQCDPLIDGTCTSVYTRHDASRSRVFFFPPTIVSKGCVGECELGRVKVFSSFYVTESKKQSCFLQQAHFCTYKMQFCLPLVLQIQNQEPHLELACGSSPRLKGNWLTGHKCWTWCRRLAGQTRQDLRCLWHTSVARSFSESTRERKIFRHLNLKEEQKKYKPFAF